MGYQPWFFISALLLISCMTLSTYDLSVGLCFLNYKKMELDKMCSKASSRWDIPSYYCASIQVTAEGVSGWTGGGKRGTKRGRVGRSLSLRISLCPIYRKSFPGILPDHRAALEHRVQNGFPGPEAGLPPQARSAESLLPLPSPSGPRFFPFLPAPLMFTTGFRRLPRDGRTL